MLTITDTAKGKIKEVLDQNEGKYLRVFISQIGWGGPQMGMALDEPKEDEKPVKVNGLDVLIADFASPFAEDTVIDYITNEYNEGFTIGRDGEAC